MVRHFVVNSVHKDLFAGAARGHGAQIVARPFTSGDLELLKAPALLAFDAGRSVDLTPDSLQSLRRSHRGGVRYSPAVAVCRTQEEAQEWRRAGVVAILGRAADKARVTAAIDEAIKGMNAWVTSASYVGPCRRKRKAVLSWQRRRSQDEAERKPTRKEQDMPVRVASLEVLHRRLTLGATLLSGATIESRRAFRDLAQEIEASAAYHRRHDLLGPLAALKREAEAFVQNGQRDGGALEAVVAEIGRHLGR